MSKTKIGIAPTHEILELCGKALFGDYWKRPLAELIGVDEAQIRRWATGKAQLHPDSIHLGKALRALGTQADLLDAVSAGLMAQCAMASAEQAYFDLAEKLIMDDGSVATLGFKSFCRLMTEHIGLRQLGLDEEGQRAALQSAWEKVHT